MKQRWFIIGAGGLGREIFAWLKNSEGWNPDCEFGGFLDKNPKALEKYPMTVASIVGDPDTYLPQLGDRFVCAIGAPHVRRQICESLMARGAEFPIVRHPFSVVGDNCQLGAGCILCPGAILTTDATVGKFVIVNLHSTICHDARVGDYTTLSAHVDITGFAQVGESVFLGSHASVLPSAKVGDQARVGAGSVVLRSVKAGATVIGVPAKQILP